VKAFFDVLHQATHAAGRRGHYPAFISQQIQKRTGCHGLPMYGGEVWASQRDSAVYWLCVIALNRTIKRSASVSPVASSLEARSCSGIFITSDLVCGGLSGVLDDFHGPSWL